MTSMPGPTVGPASISLCLVLSQDPLLAPPFLDDIKNHVNEIVVVDFTSDDRTAGIVRRYTDRLFVKPAAGSQEEGLRFGIGQARCPWVLILDVMERLDSSLKKGLERLTGSGHDAYWIPVRSVGPDGTVLAEGEEYALRLFQRKLVGDSQTDKVPRIDAQRPGKVEGAYILKRPCTPARRGTGEGFAAARRASGILRLQEALQSGSGEDAMDIGLFLDQMEKGAPLMDREEAFVRFLYELSKE